MTAAAGRERTASTVIVLMLAVLAVRLHELIPRVELIRPALTVSLGGFAFLASRAPHGTLRLLTREPAAKFVLAYFAWAVVGVQIGRAHV